MRIRRSLAAISLAAALGTLATRAAEPAKGAAGPVSGGGQAASQTPSAPSTPNQPAAPVPSNNSRTNNAPANNAPANNAGPNGSGNAGQSSNARGTHRGGDNNAKGDNAADPREQRRAARTVYVPGYGYGNWSGDYGNPYWSGNSGAWYSNDGYQPLQQSPSNDDGAAAPVQSARPQEEAAQAEMTSARTRLSKQFESNEEVRSALHDVQEAQRAYDAAVANASRGLKKDRDYKQAEAEKQRAARKVEAVQAADRQPAADATATQPEPFSPEVTRAAQQKLNAASKENAIAADHAPTEPAVIAAREKLEAAADRLNGMKDKFDASLQADPQWQAAKQKLDAITSPR